MRKLHIGGIYKAVEPGWEILNHIDAPGVDHIMDARDLSGFDSDTFGCIYASHVVEHFDYTGELQATLAEWLRVLQPGGMLYVSVPDIEVIARLILDKENLDFNDRFFAMRMLFGGHNEPDDYHLVGLSWEFLREFLLAAGYVDVSREERFDMFKDSSGKVFKDVLISLNMTAVKPSDPGQA